MATRGRRAHYQQVTAWREPRLTPQTAIGPAGRPVEATATGPNAELELRRRSRELRFELGHDRLRHPCGPTARDRERSHCTQRDDGGADQDRRGHAVHEGVT